MEKKIKSALELAMEKIANMPKLTPEEVRKQEVREYKTRGEVIANKYLGNALRATDLEAELNKYQGKEREIVKEALLSTLCQSIGLNALEKSKRAVKGIQRLERSIPFEEIKGKLEKISSEFHQEIQQKYTTLEKLEKEKLQSLWISGSAIKPNLKEREDWQHQLEEIQQVYDLRINKLKEKLFAK